MHEVLIVIGTVFLIELVSKPVLKDTVLLVVAGLVLWVTA